MRIAEATHNAVLIEVVGHLWKGMFGPIFAKLSERTRLTHKQHMTLSDHRAIFGCIERRDLAAAYASMLAHLVNVELTLMEGEEESWGRLPDPFILVMRSLQRFYFFDGVRRPTIPPAH